ncbi:MAG TPA: leucine--tRNA ligase [bacterium]|nr:leucine--tRNA ligase [bacterium]HPD03458.1 leucine--tRNA ligase [bacterium]HPL83437.1 leucine--tRNA ligase [bacterium]
MEKYQHQKFEAKWEAAFQSSGLYWAGESVDKDKYYILDMFPYPSGSGLHVGHPKGYIASDIVARYQRMRGYDVLHPMGWDAFGLPAENYALKNKIHPSVAVERNIAIFKKQLSILGLSYDWRREIKTSDPRYYRWTQWIFLQFYNSFYDRKAGRARPISELTVPQGLNPEERRTFIDNHRLAYESNRPINWCPTCKTGLAKEDLEEGRCERCGSKVELKPLRQWVLRITEYADRLLADLDLLPEWEESIREMQRAWIGRSRGVNVNFVIRAGGQEIGRLAVFTTRPDTLFGCTYVAICPEQPLLLEIASYINNWPEIEQYIHQASQKTELDRTDLNKDKTGIRLEGCEAINPVTNQAVPIFVADYVLGNYGQGAIMAVPAHDERDYLFAQKYSLPILPVIISSDDHLPYTGSGKLINSQFLNGLEVDEAQKAITNWLVEQGVGEEAINYRLEDWTFSRQRYWGEPIPMIHCPQCGTVPVPAEELPVLLPMVDHYEPSGTGESPLITIKEWLHTTCPQCGGLAEREVNTMPQWAGSSWYYLRYLDPHNDKCLVDHEIERRWSPVDLYVGGAEHATRHLIYARFWHKFLYDLGIVNYPEPFTKLRHVGLIIGEDGRKMSKRWGNIVNPDDMVAEFGADALRLYEMFMGPFDQSSEWHTSGLKGTRRFLDKVWFLQAKITNKANDLALEAQIERTIAKVGGDIENFKFNTAISALMILVNKLCEQTSISRDSYLKLLIILSPFAPYLTQELWSSLGNKGFISEEIWPTVNDQILQTEMTNLVVQFNGKTRGTLSLSVGMSQQEVVNIIKQTPELNKYWLDQTEPQKIIFLPNKLINFVF